MGNFVSAESRVEVFRENDSLPSARRVTVRDVIGDFFPSSNVVESLHLKNVKGKIDLKGLPSLKKLTIAGFSGSLESSSIESLILSCCDCDILNCPQLNEINTYSSDLRIGHCPRLHEVRDDYRSSTVKFCQPTSVLRFTGNITLEILETLMLRPEPLLLLKGTYHGTTFPKSIRADEIEISTDSTEVQMNVECRSLHLRASGCFKMELSGKCDHLELSTRKMEVVKCKLNAKTMRIRERN